MSTSTETGSTDSGGSVTVTGTLTTNNGGELTIDEDNPMISPGPLQVTDYGVAFGPLELIAYPGSTARIGGLEFIAKTGWFDGLFGSDSEGGLFGAAGLLAVANREEDLGRRDALKTACGLGLIAGGAAMQARAATRTRTQAQFSLTANPGGFRVRVRDRTPDYLPTSTSYYIYVNSAEYSQFSAANAQSYGDVLPELTGTVVVGPKGSGGSFLERLTADRARSYEGLTLTNADGEVVDVASVDAGTELTITDNDVMVEAAQAAGASETTLAINGTSIPHRHESTDSPVGRYLFQDGEIRYIVGSDAPSGQTASLSLYVDRTTEFLDDLSRRSN